MQQAPLNVIELRQYTMQPGRRDDLVELFEREFIAPQNALGLHVLGIFRDAERSDRFVWLRGYTDMAARRLGLQAFYGGPVWQAHRAAANATMVDSSDVLLLRPLSALPAPGAPPATAWNLVVCPLAAPPDDGLRAALRADLGAAWLETEPAANTFPALPVREGVTVVVGLVRTGARALPTLLHHRMTGQPQRLVLRPTPQSPLQ